MIQCRVQTLIVSQSATPSVLVLQANTDNKPLTTTRVVPIWMGLTEATQIGLALEQIRFIRPMTHDLFINALVNLDSYIDHVLINDVQQSTFYAQVIIHHHARTIILDARPSDAITLALRQGSPIYIDEATLDRASYPYIFKRDAPITEEDIDEFHSFVKTLTPDDFND